MKKTIIILTLILFSLFGFAQTKAQFKKQLKEAVENIRNEKQANVYAFDLFCKAIPNDVLQELKSVENDTLNEIRHFVLQLQNNCSRNSQDSSIRKEVVNKLAKACKDEDAANRSIAALYLTRYNKQDFSKDAKQQFSDLLQSEYGYYKHVVQLVAYLDMTDEMQELQGLLSDTTHNDPMIKWKIHTALARLGSEESIDYCVQYVKSKDMNDLLVRFVLRDLAYIKQPAAVGYLVSELYNKEKNCRAANPNSSGRITCAYRIMEMLAPIVKDYPYKAKYGTQLDAPNYDKALKDIRQWFKDHPDYVIMRDKF